MLSLFDGMSCGQIAFRQLGVEVDRYISYEIDRNDFDVEDADTLLEMIEHSGVCAADDVIKILYSD